MSVTPSPEGAATAVATDGEPVSVNDAINNAANDANAHTPDPPAVPAAEAIPDPPSEPTNAGGGLDELRTIVSDLATGLTTVQETVLKLSENDTPARIAVPWTHKWGKRS